MNSKLIALEIFQAKISDVHLESVLTTLDRLHDASAQQTVCTETNMEPAQLVGWLEDIIFTAQETLKELQAKESCNTQDHANSSDDNAVIKLYRQG